MQHGSEADARAEMLWVIGDGDSRLGRGLKQQGVDDALVLIGDVRRPGTGAALSLPLHTPRRNLQPAAGRR